MWTSMRWVCSKMSRTIVLLLSAYIAFGFLTYSESVPDGEDASEISNERSENDGERSGAFAHAVSVSQQRPHPQPQPHPTPNPLLVECYVCTDCPEVNENTPSKLCPNVFPQSSSKCVVYAEKYRHMDRAWFIRGCASERGTCADIRKAHENYPNIVKLLFCDECDGERCNRNGASSLAECTIAFIMMIVTPLVSKFTLS